MRRSVGLVDVVTAARHAELLLAPLGDRWLHTQAVAQQARAVAADLVDLDADLLVAAAYLHDLGYSPPLALTGFHPLDGADYLCAIGEPRLARLVANHSGAKYEAAVRGWTLRLKAYPDDADLLSSCLTYCDLTTGPRGQRVSLAERLHDIHRRYGDGHPVQRAIALATPELYLTVSAVETRLAGRRFRGGG